MRQDNAALDDESAKAVDLVSGELSGIAQAVRVKRDLFGSNEQRLVSLQAEVRCNGEPGVVARSLVSLQAEVGRDGLMIVLQQGAAPGQAAG